MSSLKVFISSPVYVTIDSGSSSVIASPFCLVELWLAIFWPCSQDFLVFSLSRPKKVFYVSSRICSSLQNKEDPPAHYKKRFCLFLTLQKVTMVLKTF